jgi:hypothetical protein
MILLKKLTNLKNLNLPYNQITEINQITKINQITESNEKILITGTGRCGTTFLIKLFTFLGFDTGFDKTNYQMNTIVSETPLIRSDYTIDNSLNIYFLTKFYI